jgi:Ca2+-binding EF-hand superfamily protein
VASQAKVDAKRNEELERFFAEQSALQDETRAFQKYDSDSSGSIDTEELYKLLGDLGAFEDVDESERKGLCEKVLMTNDTDKDGTISFRHAFLSPR